MACVPQYFLVVFWVLFFRKFFLNPYSHATSENLSTYYPLWRHIGTKGFKQDYYPTLKGIPFLSAWYPVHLLSAWGGRVLSLDHSFILYEFVKLAHYLPLARRVIDQAQRRIIDGEKVPANEKLLSIFESDTDLIVRGSRDPIYGHKLVLTVGASFVLDCTIERGNPTDSTLAKKMIERINQLLGRAPKQAVFDGGFSSIDNVAAIKQLGVEDVAFTKHAGIEITDMVKSAWVFKRLRRFRAGVEGCISFLKRCFGLARCTWRGGREGFGAYVWSSILSANLLTLARHTLT